MSRFLNLIVFIGFLLNISRHSMAITCSDGESTCPSGNTCCANTGGSYGCCPLPNAVCCPDGIHCCPQGTTCGSGGLCNR